MHPLNTMPTTRLDVTPSKLLYMFILAFADILVQNKTEKKKDIGGQNPTRHILNTVSKDVARSFERHQSDLAGRMTSGSCGPLSGLEVRKGRVTIIDRPVISLGGTASSKSNARTKENKSAFILISQCLLAWHHQGTNNHKGNLLDDGKAVADTRVGA